MLLKILSFGCNWWYRFGHNPEDRYRYSRHAAFYNSAGVQCGNKVRRHWVIPGLIRFNGAGDFDPHHPHHAVGTTFSCTEPIVAYGGNRLVLHEQVRMCARPDFHLITLSSEQYGNFDFHSEAWRSSGTYPIAASQLREKQEVMLLMRHGDWVCTSLGRWELTPTSELALGVVLQLAE